VKELTTVVDQLTLVGEEYSGRAGADLDGRTGRAGADSDGTP